MDRRYAAASALHVRLVGLADWLNGCAHRKTTFPITLRPSVSVDGEQSAQSDTYIVCLQCGRHFAYDWTMMRIAKQRAGRDRRRPGLGGTLGFHREAEASRGSR
jgi:hypothetical protein